RGANRLRLQLRLSQEEHFRGVIFSSRRRHTIWEEDTLGARFHEEEIPADMAAEAARHREQLIEIVADADDILLEKYLAGKALSEAEITMAIRKKTQEMALFPVVCGTALRNKGLQPLL